MQKIVLVLLACLVMAACGPAAQATFPVVATVPTAHDTLTPLPTGSATLVASLTPSQASTRSPSRTPVPYIPASTTTPLPALQAGQPLTLTSLRMIDLRTGWATEASGHILRTTDGGSSWRDVTPPDGIYQAANFFALDAITGKKLWNFPTGSGHRGSAITYSVNGRQYIATPSGWGSALAGLLPQLWPETESFPPGSTLFVFALPPEER